MSSGLSQLGLETLYFQHEVSQAGGLRFEKGGR